MQRIISVFFTCMDLKTSTRNDAILRAKKKRKRTASLIQLSNYDNN
jgi:hypothetical protein